MTMTRRQLFAQGAAAVAPGARATPPYNILLIASDDMNTSLGCYGHPVAKTPHLDALARRGVRFDRAYCQFPLCGPSRASCLTGLRPDHTQVLENNVDFRHHLPRVTTLPQLFRRSGWQTARDGKMFHMNVPNEVGTPRFQDPPSWDVNYSPPGLELNTQGPRGRLTGGMQWIAAATPAGQADHTAADEAVALLERFRHRPFFLGLGFIRPHLPFVAPARFFDQYPAGTLEPFLNPPDDLADVPRAHWSVRPQQWRHQNMSEAEQREALRGYFASTSFMDDQCGRVLDALKRLGLAQRTIVAFWGDHGWHLGEHTKWQKMSLFEPAARIPLIVAAPGMKGNGRFSRALVELVDLYPTLTQLCRLKPPHELEGQSLAPLLANPSRGWKKAAFTQIQFEKRITGRSLRAHRYRYTVWEGEGGGEELYDHSADPGEFTNLAAKPESRLALESMRKLMRGGWRAARAG
jgi:uncharacterized sulfatase